MKKAILLLLISLPLASVAYAQTQDYFLWYGNPDGSDMMVLYDTPIEIPVYFQGPACGDLDGDGVCDSVNFAHLPLATDDLYVASRDDGNLEYFPFGLPDEGDCIHWDDVNFKPPEADAVIPDWTNQSIVGFAEMIGPPPYPCFLNTEGEQWQIASFFMTTTPGVDYGCFTVMAEGTDPDNGGVLMGIQDGVTPIFPAQTFSCLHFVEYFAGDANGSGEVNGLDVIYLVNYLKDIGPAPDPILSGDANGDCLTNGLDVIYLVNYLKGIGPPPVLGDCP